MRRGITLLFCLSSLTGCGTTPANSYYTLSVCPPSIDESQGHPGSHLALASVRLPALIDRLQVVVRTGPHTVDIEEFDRWAEPLDEMVARVLRQDLDARLGPQVLGQPITHLYVAIDEFSPNRDGNVALIGRWWIGSDDERNAPLGMHTFTLTLTANGDQGVQYALAMSLLLGKLADQIVRG